MLWATVGNNEPQKRLMVSRRPFRLHVIWLVKSRGDSVWRTKQEEEIIVQLLRKVCVCSVCLSVCSVRVSSLGYFSPFKHDRVNHPSAVPLPPLWLRLWNTPHETKKKTSGVWVDNPKAEWDSASHDEGALPERSSASRTFFGILRLKEWPLWTEGNQQ